MASARTHACLAIHKPGPMVQLDCLGMGCNIVPITKVMNKSDRIGRKLKVNDQYRGQALLGE